MGNVVAQVARVASQRLQPTLPPQLRSMAEQVGKVAPLARQWIFSHRLHFALAFRLD